MTSNKLHRYALVPLATATAVLLASASIASADTTTAKGPYTSYADCMDRVKKITDTKALKSAIDQSTSRRHDALQVLLQGKQLPSLTDSDQHEAIYQGINQDTRTLEDLNSQAKDLTDTTPLKDIYCKSKFAVQPNGLRAHQIAYLKFTNQFLSSNTKLLGLLDRASTNSSTTSSRMKDEVIAKLDAAKDLVNANISNANDAVKTIENASIEFSDGNYTNTLAKPDISATGITNFYTARGYYFDAAAIRGASRLYTNSDYTVRTTDIPTVFKDADGNVIDKATWKGKPKVASVQVTLNVNGKETPITVNFDSSTGNWKAVRPN